MSYEPRDPPNGNVRDVELWAHEEFRRLKDYVNFEYGFLWADSGSFSASLTTTPIKLVWAENGSGINDWINDEIRPTRDGTYLAAFSLSFAGSASIDYTFRLAINGVLTEYGVKREGGTDGVAALIPTPLGLSEGDLLSIFASSSSASSATIEYGQFSCIRIGD